MDDKLELGADPARGRDNSFVSFTDPDDYGWLVQEIRQGEAAR